MSDSVKMPALGESVTEGTVTRWLKAVGDSVEVDEPLLEVATDKVDTEIPSPFAGVLEQILVQEDETVAVGTELAVIGTGEGGGAQPAAPAAAEQPAPTPAAAPEPAQAAPQPEAAPEQPAAPPTPAPTAGEGGGGGQAVKMPALGESVTEGTVTRWLKSVGDSVEVDEPLLEVATDKVDTEIPSPIAGVLTQILVGEDETAAVGQDLAIIGSGAAAGGAAGAPAPAVEAGAPPEEPAPEPTAGGPSPETPEAAGQPVVPPSVAAPEAPQPEAAETAPAGAAAASAAVSGSSYLTPLVRKLAADKGVDLATLKGTGVGGRIRKEDVLEAAERAEAEKAAAERAAAEKAAAPAPAPPAAGKPAAAPAAPSPLRGTRVKMTRLRKVVAERMVEAMQSTAQLTTVVEVDVTRVAKLRAKAKGAFEAREGVKLTFLPFFVLAATEALKQHPKINASIEGPEIVYHGEENIGIAVDTDRGLVVPVIRGAGDLNMGGIARKIADLAARTRSNKIGPDELSGATFTVTNTGSGGALFDTPIVALPQVAILGVGTIVKRPVVVTDADGNEVIGTRSMVYLALSYDHQLVDGADAARYLMAVKSRIEAGAFEADLGV
jgi:pyruvate dehydrogenase E2 component (dihydrolipoamide acetyltransferase)